MVKDKCSTTIQNPGNSLYITQLETFDECFKFLFI